MNSAILTASLAPLLPLLAVVLDYLVGDPRSQWHPVVVIGKLIAALEKILLRPAARALSKKMAGAILVICTLSLTFSIVWLLCRGIQELHPLAALLGNALLVSFTISPQALSAAGREIRDLMASGDLQGARAKVGWIVGRDTDSLTTGEISRATVETIAENIVDGIISPLFYALLGGAPLAFLYRAVNTMDSMIGYRNEKYGDFGMVAARVDDVFNYVPARITSLLVLGAAVVLHFDFTGALRSVWRDAAKHPSPNSGFAEAAVAGALGIRLGGLNYYGGVESFRAYMGEEKEVLTPVHITKTITVMYTATWLFVLVQLLVQGPAVWQAVRNMLQLIN